MRSIAERENVLSLYEQVRMFCVQFEMPVLINLVYLRSGSKRSIFLMQLRRQQGSVTYGARIKKEEDHLYG